MIASLLFLAKTRPEDIAIGAIAVALALCAGVFVLRRFVVGPLFDRISSAEAARPVALNVILDVELERPESDELVALSALIEAAPIATVVVDTSGTLMLANVRAEQLLSYGRGDLLGQSIETLIPERLKQGRLRPWGQSFVERSRDVTGKDFDLIALRRDGTEIPVEVGLRHVATSSGSLAIASIVDVTERRNAEQLRAANATIAQHNDELRAVNSELEAFSYSVSHDLRSPVRAIIGYAQAIEEDYANVLDAGGLRLLSVVRDEAARMGDLIDDLLSFSRLGRKAMESSPVMMRRVAEDVLAEQMEIGEISSPISSISNLPDVIGDPILIRQVWTNLISNAIKYSRLSEHPKIAIWGEVRGDSAHYHVRDNGVGFDMRYADKLFGVFQRLHRSDDYPGTGVGLAIVQRIVHRHGGTVNRRLQARTRRDVFLQPTDWARMTEYDNVDVLIVEDSRFDAEMIMRALVKANFLNPIHWVKDGVEALEFIRCEGAYKDRQPQVPLKVVLLDLKMPRLDGFDVLRELKSREATRSIPIVTMTSSNQEEDVIESYRLGANGYVTKPVQFSEFISIVTKIGMFWLMVNKVD